jgi:hypothetical protein
MNTKDINYRAWLVEQELLKYKRAVESHPFRASLGATAK